jgi:uncharacterized membrane protein YedE/YeeE
MDGMDRRQPPDCSPSCGGAALFDVGWGLAGVCPGPALTDLATLDAKNVLFVVAMPIGMVATKTPRKRVIVTQALRPVLN